jgi:hypothetical protein
MPTLSMKLHHRAHVRQRWRSATLPAAGGGGGEWPWTGDRPWRVSAGGGILGLTTYLGGDLTSAHVGSFFSACADLYRREPWTLFADDQCLFQVTRRALAMNPVVRLCDRPGGGG